jgi:hypothetical protein
MVQYNTQQIYFPRPAPKNKAEDGTAFLPSNPSCRAVRHIFFEIATKKKKVERSESAFHSRKNHSGFSAKNVRTSSKNFRNGP